MNIAIEMFKLKIEHLMESEHEYDFPEFIRLVRKTTGFSRRFVADRVGCSETKILYLEKGDYGTRGPDYQFIVDISHFFGLNGKKMLTKFRKYMTQLRAKIKSETIEKEIELSGNSGQLEFWN